MFNTPTLPVQLEIQLITMSLSLFNTIDIIEIMENAIERMRPPEDIRDKLDLGYRLENQSVILFEIRPKFNDPSIKMELDFAKATFVKSTNKWRIYWMRGNLKWDSYEPEPESNNLHDFLKKVNEDKYHCFFG